MLKQNVSWFQGWKIILRCAQFDCENSTPKFASTAILKHMPPPSDNTSLAWLRPTLRSIIFPDEAFDTQADADLSTLMQARREILALNGNTDTLTR